MLRHRQSWHERLTLRDSRANVPEMHINSLHRIPRETRAINVLRRIAFMAAVLLLLLQGVPILACAAMPGQPLMSCCCQSGGTCATSIHPDSCTAPEACCTQAAGSVPALALAAAHLDDPSVALPIGGGAVPPYESAALIEQQLASHEATQLYHRQAPLSPAVPLYLRHLRLTL